MSASNKYVMVCFRRVVHQGRVDPGAADGERRLGRVPAMSVRRRGRQPLHAQVVPRQGRILQIRSQGAALHAGVLAARIQSRRKSSIFLTSLRYFLDFC